MRHFSQRFLPSILAGIFISIGGAIFLKIGGIVGAIMFSIGLISVVKFGTPLYTGRAGFIKLTSISDWSYLIVTIIGNVLGCFIFAELIKYACPDLQATACKIINTRIQAGFMKTTTLAIGCGMLMTTAVKFAKQNDFIPLLFAVPVFILCGFVHSIADAFYFWMSPNLNYIQPWLGAVLGNFIGCNLYRIFISSK